MASVVLSTVAAVLDLVSDEGEDDDIDEEEFVKT